MGLFCFLGCLNDYILGNYFIIGYKYVYIYIIYLINDTFTFCYLKFMMEKLYYHYTELLVIWGILGVIVKLIIFSGMIIHEYVIDTNDIVRGFHTYFTQTNVFTIIFLQFFYFLLDGGVYYLLTLLELYYLRPNHMIITDEINVYLDIFFYEERRNKYYSLIVFLIQMFVLLFYYEILEWNFLGLNINTAKNIQFRERSESQQRESVLSEIELGDQYYIKNQKSRESDEGTNEKGSPSDPNLLMEIDSNERANNVNKEVDLTLD